MYSEHSRESMWAALLRIGASQKLIDVLCSLYQNTMDRIRTYGDLSDEFLINSAVKQGCVASPFLFNFVVDRVLNSTLDPTTDGPQLEVNGALGKLTFADNIALLANRECLLNRLAAAAAVYGLHIKPGKFTYYSKTHRPPLLVFQSTARPWKLWKALFV